MLPRINTLLILLVGLTVACSYTTETADTNADARSSIQKTSRASPVRPGPDVERLLQGNWQSMADPNETFTVSGPKRINSYTGQRPLSLTFAYSANCEELACVNRKSRYGCVTTAGEFDIDCQAIIQISATELEVTNGNTGQTIRYRKKS